MKKVLVVFIVVATCILVSSCNKQACPAYAEVDQELIEDLG